MAAPTLATPATAADWPRIFAVSALVGLFAIAVGGTPVLLAVLLQQQQQLTGAAIGLSAAMTPLGLIASAWLAPPLARQLGAWRLATLAAFGGALLLLAMAALPSPGFWLVARFAWGLAIGAFYIVNKAWIAQLTPEGRRGRIIGLYTALLAAGFSLGPLALSVLGFAGNRGFLFIAGALALAGSGLLVLRGQLPAFRGTAAVSVAAFLPQAPVLLLAAAMFGIFDHATLAFLPQYGVASGVPLERMVAALAALNVGNVLLQAPLGWLADRYSPRPVLIACCLLAAGGALLLPYTVTTRALWPLLLVWGALAYGLATLSLAELGNRCSGTTLLAGSAALTMAGGIGGVAGPPLAGASIDAFGPPGLPLALAAGFTLVAALAATLGLFRDAAGPAR